MLGAIGPCHITAARTNIGHTVNNYNKLLYYRQKQLRTNTHTHIHTIFNLIKVEGYQLNLQRARKRDIIVR